MRESNFLPQEIETRSSTIAYRLSYTLAENELTREKETKCDGECLGCYTVLASRRIISLLSASCSGVRGSLGGVDNQISFLLAKLAHAKVQHALLV